MKYKLSDKVRSYIFNNLATEEVIADINKEVAQNSMGVQMILDGWLGDILSKQRIEL